MLLCCLTIWASRSHALRALGLFFFFFFYMARRRECVHAFSKCPEFIRRELIRPPHTRKPPRLEKFFDSCIIAHLKGFRLFQPDFNSFFLYVYVVCILYYAYAHPAIFVFYWARVAGSPALACGYISRGYNLRNVNSQPHRHQGISSGACFQKIWRFFLSEEGKSWF